jgi:hypothetical protein
MENNIANWFFDGKDINDALYNHAKASDSVAHLEKAAKAAGFKHHLDLMDSAHITRLMTCDVTFSRIPKEPESVTVIVVSYVCKLTRDCVAKLFVFADLAAFHTPKDDRTQDVVRMACLNGKWVAHVTSFSQVKTGDPMSTVSDPCLVKLIEAYRSQYGLLAFRKALRTQVLWCVKGLNDNHPFIYYFVSPSVPTIRETMLTFDRAFLWLTSDKAFAFMPRSVEYSKFLSIEAVSMCTSDMDLYNAAGIALSIDFVHPTIEDATRM